MKKYFFILILFVLENYTFSQTKKSVLFIGNSYTYVNNLPQLLSDIAHSKSDSVLFDSNTPGGYTFQMHASDATTLQKIKSKKWDVVVLQGQSQEPSLAPNQVLSQSYPYVKRLCDSIRKNNSCTEIVLYLTWGRKNGDLSNCASYPPVCSYLGMQARLRESYILFKDSFMTTVAPVGVAWKTFRNVYPTINLYDTDESHPSLHGSYLAACVFYSTIFNKSSIGSNFNPSLPSSDVSNIQTICSQTVLDSGSTWNLNSSIPKSSFSYSIIPPYTCQFTNHSMNAGLFYWSFGSSLAHPNYTFSGPGTFSVQLKSYNNCASDSSSKIVTLTNVNEFKNSKEFSIKAVGKELTIVTESNAVFSAKILDLKGNILMESGSSFRTTTIDLAVLTDGIYIVCVEVANSIYREKIILKDNSNNWSKNL